MAEEFKAITTQEEFDTAIKSRLDRERKTIQSQYADYESLKQQVADLTKEKGDLEKAASDEKKALQDRLDAADAKAKTLELDALRTKVAVEKKLPLELRTRLSGETEEEIRADADSLAKLFRAEQRRDLPGYKPERAEGDQKDAALRNLLKDISNAE